MCKRKWLSFIMVLSFFFLSCDMVSDSEDTMNEAYAGTWYTAYTDPDYGDSVLIYNLKDSSFSISLYLSSIGIELVVEKGTLRKISDSLVEYLATHMYSQESSSLEESSSAARNVNYSLSADGKTLLFDDKTFSDTDPRG